MSTESFPIATILAGGKSRRIGGGNKCLLELNSKSILDHIIERLKPQTSDIILNLNALDDFSNYSHYSQVKDESDSYLGPLSGIFSVMNWIEKQKMQENQLIVVSGDCPFIPLNLVRQLLESQKKDRIVIANSNGRNHYTIGLWPLTFKTKINQYLDAGNRSIKGFVKSEDVISCPFSFEKIDPFFNINTPEDYQYAKKYFE